MNLEVGALKSLVMHMLDLNLEVRALKSRYAYAIFES
jgi:hypothetical protein